MYIYNKAERFSFFVLNTIASVTISQIFVMISDGLFVGDSQIALRGGLIRYLNKQKLVLHIMYRQSNKDIFSSPTLSLYNKWYINVQKTIASKNFQASHLTY